jgi:hypothetical protein
VRDDLLQRMAAWVGDLTQPGREVDRVAVEVAASRTTNVLHDGPATGSDGEHGKAEVYSGHLRYGSNQWAAQIKDKAEALKKDSRPALQSLAHQRGYYGAHPPKPERFELVEKYQAKVMESYTADGERVVAPVYGNGTSWGSKFDHVKLSDPTKPMEYGSQQRSRIADVRDAPRLPSGEIDMDTVCEEQNVRHGHIRPTGHFNQTVGGIGPRLGRSGIDKYPTAADFKK